MSITGQFVCVWGGGRSQIQLLSLKPALSGKLVEGRLARNCGQNQLQNIWWEQRVHQPDSKYILISEFNQYAFGIYIALDFMGLTD